MGWTHCYKRQGQTAKEFLATDSGCLRWSDLPEGAHPEIVGSATGGKMIAFAVRFPAAFYDARQGQPPGYYIPALDGSVTVAICFLTSNGEGPKSHYNFGYKDMSETMGPREHVSASILPLLSPLNPEDDSGSAASAREWREGCTAYSAARGEATKQRAALRVGACVTLRKAVKFSNFEAATFEVVSYTRRGKTKLSFRAANGALCRLSAAHLAQATIS